MGQDEKTSPVPADLMEFTPEQWAFYDIVIKAQQGDQAAVRELKKPCNARLMATFGVIQEMIKRLICESACGEYNAVAIGMYRKMEAIQGDLGGSNPSAVETMLAELAAIAWGDWLRCVKVRECLGDCTFRKATYYDGRVDRSHKRLVRSLRAWLRFARWT